MELDDTKRYPIARLAEIYHVAPTTLRDACQRYVKSDGKHGLSAEKLGRDWQAYPADAREYLLSTGRHKHLAF